MRGVSLSAVGPGYFLGDPILNSSHQAGNHVDFIAVGDGNDDRCFGDTCLAKQADTSPGSMDGLDIKSILDAADLLHVAIDDHHVFFFLGKPVGKMKPNFPRPDNDNAHLLLDTQRSMGKDILLSEE